MPSEWKRATFHGDWNPGKTYPGWFREADNRYAGGWYAPYFEEEVVNRLVEDQAELRQTEGMTVAKLYWRGATVCEDDSFGGDPIEYPAGVLDTDEGLVIAWNVGGGIWTWDAIEEPRKRSRHQTVVSHNHVRKIPEYLELDVQPVLGSELALFIDVFNADDKCLGYLVVTSQSVGFYEPDPDHAYSEEGYRWGSDYWQTPPPPRPIIHDRQ